MLVQLPMRFRAPYADEALMGYVAECAREYAAHPVALLEGANCPLSLERVPFLSREQSDRLSSLLSQESQRLESLTYKPLPKDRKVPLIGFHNVMLRRSHLLVSRRRLSPAAMRESNHIRSLSHVLPIGFCPETWTMLTERCLKCGQDLTWPDLEHASACHRCSADQRDFETESVPLELRDMLKLWVNLIHPVPAVQKEAASVLPTPLKCMNPGEVFDLALGLADTIYGRASGANGTAASMAAIMTWPTGIIDALAEDLENCGNGEPLTSRLRRYAQTPKTLSSVRKLLLYDLSYYRGMDLGVKAEIDRDLRKIYGFTVREAAKYLGIAPTDITALRRAGVLETSSAVRGRLRRDLLTCVSCDETR